MEQLTVSREIVKQKYLTGNKDERKLLKELFFSDEYQITLMVWLVADCWPLPYQITKNYKRVVTLKY